MLRIATDIQCSLRCLARSVVLLKPLIVGNHMIENLSKERLSSTHSVISDFLITKYASMMAQN